jgi:small subunit ribosomal protein S2
VEGITQQVGVHSSGDDKPVIGRSNMAKQSNAAQAANQDSNASRTAQSDVPAERAAVEINLRSLLQAGVHFGHQTSRWHPGMAPYIYTSRNGIHIVHLPKTVQCWKAARQQIVNVASDGGAILFVGTKKQAQDAVVSEARGCGAHYVSRRWLGGMMTNFQTIRKSIERMGKVEAILKEEEESMSAGSGSRFTKKERLMMTRELEKLEFSLGGIRNMNAIPQLLFVIDIKREEIAVREARRLDIPVVALVDTNCDPALATYAIPSNDDGSRAIRLFCAAVGDAVREGNKIYQDRVARGEFSTRDRGISVSARGRSESQPVHVVNNQPAETAESSAQNAGVALDSAAAQGSSKSANVSSQETGDQSDTPV